MVKAFWISSKTFSAKCELCEGEYTNCHILLTEDKREFIVCVKCVKCLTETLKLLQTSKAVEGEEEG